MTNMVASADVSMVTSPKQAGSNTVWPIRSSWPLGSLATVTDPDSTASRRQDCWSGRTVRGVDFVTIEHEFVAADQSVGRWRQWLRNPWRHGAGLKVDKLQRLIDMKWS